MSRSELFALVVILGATIFIGCGHQPAAETSFLATTPAITNSLPTLSRSQVLARFRERASATEVQEFERLATATDSESQVRATELVLFKLTSAELYQIGVGQTEYAGHFYWSLATSRAFADGGRAFQQALQRVGISPGSETDLGVFGWTVPREQFFKARQALIGANLHTNEIMIVEPRFSLQ